jgi:hypothetical protein
MSEHEKEFHFYVDAKRYETDKSSLTGLEIKTIAGIAYLSVVPGGRGRPA